MKLLSMKYRKLYITYSYIFHMKLKVNIKKLYPDTILPTYTRSGDACMDCYAVEDVIIPGTNNPRNLKTETVSLGFAVEIPEGWEMQIRPRSGLALNQGISILNVPGTIDSNYRGEVKVILYNVGKKMYIFIRGIGFAKFVSKKLQLLIGMR